MPQKHKEKSARNLRSEDLGARVDNS